MKNQLSPLLRPAHVHFNPPLFSDAFDFTPSELTFESSARNNIFLQLCKDEVEVCRTALAPKWHRGRRDLVFKKDWFAIFASWDRINSALCLSSDKNVKKLHSLRTTRASVKQLGSWIYRMWCLSDGRSYIGQTGAKGQFRRTGDRGKDHIRLGADYLRGWGPGNTNILLADVYRWICQKGPENFVITPLEFTVPSWAPTREAWWMREWGLGSLVNRDVPSMRRGKWDFLAQRKFWAKEIESAGGSLLSIAKSIASSPQPIPQHRYSPPMLLAIVTATCRYLPVSTHRTLFDRVSA